MYLYQLPKMTFNKATEQTATEISLLNCQQRSQEGGGNIVIMVKNVNKLVHAISKPRPGTSRHEI